MVKGQSTLNRCEGCGIYGTPKTKVYLTNGALRLCNQCLGDINRKNPDAKRYRAALLRLAARADTHPPADVRACVAEALGVTVGELESME